MVRKVLVLGGGGREHALCEALVRECEGVYCAPGNGGIESMARCVPLEYCDVRQVVSWCVEEGIELVISGSELPLAAGVVDRLEEAGILAFGPSERAVRLESSKSFANILCARYGIPKARFRVVREKREVLEALRVLGLPLVVKQDGYAGGKGVCIIEEEKSVFAHIDGLLQQQKHRQCGIVLEECLEGEELSVFFLTDGKEVLYLGSARDYKRLKEGDEGPNTGGMGAIMWPLSVEQVEALRVCFVVPTLRAMEELGCPYRGVLYLGLMKTSRGYVLIEYNCRFGDPECQVILPRLETSLLEIFEAVARGEGLGDIEIVWREGVMAGVVLAAGGYPVAPVEEGAVIGGLCVPLSEQVKIFHGATKKVGGDMVVSGGRVLTVTAQAQTMAEALKTVYKTIEGITFRGMQYRKDIGSRSLLKA